MTAYLLVAFLQVRDELHWCLAPRLSHVDLIVLKVILLHIHVWGNLVIIWRRHLIHIVLLVEHHLLLRVGNLLLSGNVQVNLLLRVILLVRVRRRRVRVVLLHRVLLWQAHFRVLLRRRVLRQHLQLLHLVLWRHHLVHLVHLHLHVVAHHLLGLSEVCSLVILAHRRLAIDARISIAHLLVWALMLCSTRWVRTLQSLSHRWLLIWLSTELRLCINWVNHALSRTKVHLRWLHFIWFKANLFNSVLISPTQTLRILFRRVLTWRVVGVHVKLLLNLRAWLWAILTSLTTMSLPLILIWRRRLLNWNIYASLWSIMIPLWVLSLGYLVEHIILLHLNLILRLNLTWYMPLVVVYACWRCNINRLAQTINVILLLSIIDVKLGLLAMINLIDLVVLLLWCNELFDHGHWFGDLVRWTGIWIIEICTLTVLVVIVVINKVILIIIFIRSIEEVLIGVIGYEFFRRSCMLILVICTLIGAHLSRLRVVLINT